MENSKICEHCGTEVELEYDSSAEDFDEIAKVAAEEGYIPESDIARLIAFRNNPSDESWIGK